MTEIEPSCPTGNGACPVECPIYFSAVEAMPVVETPLDPFMQRLSLLFADATNQDVNVVDIANVLDRCVKETGKDYLQDLRERL